MLSKRVKHVRCSYCPENQCKRVCSTTALAECLSVVAAGLPRSSRNSKAPGRKKTCGGCGKVGKAWHQHARRWRRAEQPTHNHAACTRAQAQDDATRACLAAVCVCPISPEVRQWRSTFFLGVAGLRISSPHPAQAQRSKIARATRARTSIYPATRTWCAASWSCRHLRGNRSNRP